MRKRDYFLTLGIIIALILLDQIVKLLVLNYISTSDKIPLIPGFISLVKVYNTGMAWGMLDDSTLILALISTIASIVALYFATQNDFSKKKMYSIALCFIIAGALGNMLDRYFTVAGIYKGVVDMFQFSFDFPVFNIADAVLVIGVIMLLIDILFLESKRNNNA